MVHKATGSGLVNRPILLLRARQCFAAATAALPIAGSTHENKIKKYLNTSVKTPARPCEVYDTQIAFSCLYVGLYVVAPPDHAGEFNGPVSEGSHWAGEAAGRWAAFWAPSAGFYESSCSHDILRVMVAAQLTCACE